MRNLIRKLFELRLTKYPLLFENLAKYSKSTPDEEKNVRRALKRSKEILSRIDEAVREAADIDQIAEILRKLDMTAFDKSDPTLAAEFRVSIPRDPRTWNWQNTSIHRSLMSSC